MFDVFQHRDFAVNNLEQRCGHAVGLKHPLAREHFQQHHAQRPDVGAVIHGLTQRLFRGHIGRRAHARAGHGQLAGARHAGESEIDDLDDAVRCQQNIRGLDIAVNDAVPVSVGKSASHLDCDGDCLGGRKRLRFVPDAIAEVAAFVIGHDDEPAMVRISSTPKMVPMLT